MKIWQLFWKKMYTLYHWEWGQITALSLSSAFKEENNNKGPEIRNECC